MYILGRVVILIFSFAGTEVFNVSYGRVLQPGVVGTKLFREAHVSMCLAVFLPGVLPWC